LVIHELECKNIFFEWETQQKFGGIFASGKRDYESSSGSGSGSSSIVVGASKQSAVSSCEAYGRSFTVKTTTQVASAMIHLVVTVGIWIWGSLFLSVQALIPVNSGSKGPLSPALRPLFAAPKATVGVISLGVHKACNR